MISIQDKDLGLEKNKFNKGGGGCEFFSYVGEKVKFSIKNK